jgi:hypothetical protein
VDKTGLYDDLASCVPRCLVQAYFSALWRSPAAVILAKSFHNAEAPMLPRFDIGKLIPRFDHGPVTLPQHTALPTDGVACGGWKETVFWHSQVVL